MTRKKIDFKALSSVTIKREVNEQLTLAELTRAWLAVVKNENEELLLRKWVDGFGDRVAWSLTSEELEQAIKAMVDQGYAPSTANRNLGTLGSMFLWIIKQRRAPAGFVSPTLGVQRFQEPVRRVFIEPEAIQRLKDISMTFTDPMFAVYVHLLIDTGARKSELLERTWADVDLERREIMLHDSKTGKPRVLHFSEGTAALIRRKAPQRPKDGLLFNGRVRGVPINYRSSWESLTAAAGIAGTHQHDIRHNRARELIVGGVGLLQTASILGHSSMILQKRYGHLSVADDKRAIQGVWAAAAA